jgi:Tol biopolymer transport system component
VGWWSRRGRVAIGVIAAICVATVTVSVAYAEGGRKTPVGLIVFDLTGSPPGPDEIWAVHADGTGARRLAFGYAPSWSRDGRRIAYVNPTDELAVMNADGSGKRSFWEQFSSTDLAPRWSPDDTELLFWEGHYPSPLSVVNAQGLPVTRSLTPPGAFVESGADWSPAGNKIVYSGKRGVYMIRENGRGAHRITTRPAAGLRWSPDGRKLLFIVSGDPREAGPLATMDADGTRARVVISREMRVLDAGWSPDGRQIAWASAEAPGTIWIRTLAGGADRPFRRQGDGIVAFLDWQPRA